MDGGNVLRGEVGAQADRRAEERAGRIAERERRTKGASNSHREILLVLRNARSELSDYQMGSINRILTGPTGAWINAILMGVSIFFLTQLYSDVKEWSRMLYEMKSEVRLIDYRVTMLETTQQP